jgi:mannose-1-phosphate guanylyltransferase
MKNIPAVNFPNSATNKSADRYAVILAGGDGSRLKSLTRAIAGDERPKQFCPILNNETLLDVTRRRVARTIAFENTFFSLTAKHERFYGALLTDVSRRRLIVQPENKGTAPAILYSLMQLSKIDPQATVAFFPSDHYFSDDAAFMNNVETAFQAVAVNPDSLILLGIEPEAAEASYGWIEPQESLFGNLAKSVSQVKRFWEKPAVETARRLMSGGCLWNSFVMIGKVATFLELIEKHAPGLYKIFAASRAAFGTAAESATVRALYAWITDVNFSSEILEKATGELYVLRVADVGWSDWGEPQRVLGTLANLGLQPDWLRAVAA